MGQLLLQFGVHKKNSSHHQSLKQVIIYNLCSRKCHEHITYNLWRQATAPFFQHAAPQAFLLDNTEQPRILHTCLSEDVHETAERISVQLRDLLCHVFANFLKDKCSNVARFKECLQHVNCRDRVHLW
eukprot:Skav222967  [mRNA]  locus=scaffold1489:812731:813114:+ [translate_table: standard]